jgi:hypothetical protein
MGSDKPSANFLGHCHTLMTLKYPCIFLKIFSVMTVKYYCMVIEELVTSHRATKKNQSDLLCSF